MSETIPNPGSEQAIRSGCKCPVLDNNHGKFPPVPAGTPWGGETGSWWLSELCPMHGQAAS